MRARALTAALLVASTLVVAPATAPAEPAEPYLVGRGIADATGEIAEVGMMGYGRIDQQAEGLHNRLRSRAFVVADPVTDQRVVLVVVDSPMIFGSVHQEVLRRLAQRYGDRYTEQNVLISGTHTHAGPGGYSHHLLYNLTTFGFHGKTFDAITDGIVESVERAHADLAPSSLTLTHDELTDASVNRSRDAFDRNPARDREFFPDAIDPQTSLLRVERDGRPVGAVNWFATHNTSMSGDNRLISADNKGYAAYHWEREVEHVDYHAEQSPDFVSAFAQTNAGDMSPNLDLRPPTTPEDFAATKEIGLRQFEAAVGQLGENGAALDGGVDSRLVHVDLSSVDVRPEFTGDGRHHRTCAPAVGAAMAAGSTEDGPAFPLFAEGENPLWDKVSDSVLYNASPELKQCQAPKGIVVPIGAMNAAYPWVAETVPVQLVRIGRLHLIGVPGEVTIAAGLRLRRTVADVVGADLRDVLVAGYSNAYFHYVTTPEEYDAQHYEGGSTLFGRWQLPALQQTVSGLATALRDGTPAPSGPRPPDLSDRQLSLQPGVLADVPPLGKRFGDVLGQPEPAYQAGERAEVVFAGAHPGNDLRRGGTYLEVQRWDGNRWLTVADDGDWSTTLRWRRHGLAASHVTIGWEVPPGADGTYRIRYHGDARNPFGGVRSFSGVSNEFTASG
ncbi:neutral/alkaline ceramidase [Prauserella cavernicola]|uniref:Neutral ceramidase n=1 Tax=Prauserella cavernicola TaxID=2800127 RepID=A0A934QXA1_9PSEU|nr:neutral/alkaline ceramidase [Prauserella cavernicola]MBK1786983.1 neutral/alkaline ceramidase [Prauserella cavernicola]